MKGYIVNISSSNEDEKTYIHLFGRLENQKSFAAIIPATPYFYIIESDEKKAKKLLVGTKIEKTKLVNKKNETVIKISHESQTELNKIVKSIHQEKIDTYEADLNPTIRYIIDNDLYGTIDISGESDPSERVDMVFKNPEIKKSEGNIPLKVISLDIESNKSNKDIFCIGVYGKNYEKNFIISDKIVERAVSCKDEREVLSKFREEMLSVDADIITGWNIIDFDLNLLKEKFEEHNIPFDFGRTNEKIRIKLEGNFFRNSTATIPGRQVLDGLNLIKDPFIQEAPSIKSKEFESYTLEDVSQAMLGEGKIIHGKERHDEIERLFEKDKDKLVKYNIQDCKLAYDLLIKTSILDLAIERSTLTGLPLNKLTGSIIAFDSLYIREAHKRGIVSPTTRYTEKEERIKGGFVMEPTPGIYHNVLVMDFKSLYPSIMKSFNIDPLSLLDKKEKDSIESPNSAYFKNSEGVLPHILDKLHKAREVAKKEKRELSSYAIKIIMNSFFGVLASPNCRYFSLDMANAITHFGQMIIQLTAKKIEEKGYKVIYSDTDSVFVETGLAKERTKELGKELQEYINKFYNELVKKEYNRKSFLELEFKKNYIALMLPKVRNAQKETGSKKRYAGLIEQEGKESIEIVGLEAIRGDWTQAAQEFQVELLNKIFHRQDPVIFIKNYIKKINEGKLDAKLVYRKSIRKNLEEYTKTTPPHVKAARKLDKLDSNIIEYYITLDGPEPIQKLKHKLDYEHYIEKQITPIADTILHFFNTSVEEILNSSTQKKLF
ncbi:MAG: DNA polymerase II [Candidatus Pacearchaeota archaeon]